jgi:UDP-N-acetylglucosamine diphosphorylase / glucose-1-phosphate thymidylyltransferase / UDP-N-acetylgalactosamine diphosphorylase / glucosamine-1-phosphate N-acetyltransferase / galactosamine-1-phosphate N-acetyltransferase
MLNAKYFFDISDFPHPQLFDATSYVWSALADLKEYMNKYTYPDLETPLLPIGKPLPDTVIYHQGNWLGGDNMDIEYGDTTKGTLIVRDNGQVLKDASVLMAGAVLLGDRIDIGKGVLIESGAMIKSPAIIGDYTEVRQGAYLRGYCLTGKRCVLGHTTEIKHSIFLNDAKAGHFAYLGDSILGTNANLCAGTKFANLRFIPGNVAIMFDGERVDTGMRKFGAILGDNSQTGCNSVTSPGTIFGKSCMLMPNLTAASGYHPDKSIIRR